MQTILNYQEASNLPYTLRTFITHEDVIFIGVAIALALVAFSLGLRTRLRLPQRRATRVAGRPLDLSSPSVLL